MIIRTTVHGNGIHCTLVSSEATLDSDMKMLTKMIAAPTQEDEKISRWVREEPADKKAWKYRGYSMHWDKGRETWVMMKDGYEEWDATTRGEVREWIDGSKDEGRNKQ